MSDKERWRFTGACGAGCCYRFAGSSGSDEWVDVASFWGRS